MSGGHFDLSPYKLLDVATELEDWLSKNPDYPPPGARQRLLQLAEDSRVLSERLKAADYLICGDYSTDSFHDAWDKTLKGAGDA
jgi:dsDNA-binding SOS-regulon protein